MRPTKLTPALLDALRAVLADQLAAVAFTEEELVWQANQHLPLEQQITYRTFQRYKAEIMGSETGNGEDEENKEDTQKTPEQQQTDAHNTELVRQMCVTLKSALLKQKFALVKGIHEGLPNWRRYSWMLERKFPDFRLRPVPIPTPNNNHQSDSKPTTSTPTIPKAQPKPEEAALPELTEKEKVHRKWLGKIPWAPMYERSSRSIGADELFKIEHDLALDEAATGYQNPYTHYGYLPDERREGGFYVFTGMGLDKLCHRHYIGPDDSRLPLSKELIASQWVEQEKERKQALANQQDHAAEVQHRQLEARMAARKDAMGGKCFYEPEWAEGDEEPKTRQSINGALNHDPWDGEPRPTPNPDQPSNGGGRIWGCSA